MSKQEDEKKDASKGLEPLEENVKYEVEKLKRKGIHSAPLETLANTLDAPPKAVQKALRILQEEYDIKFKLTETQTIPKRFKQRMNDPIKHKQFIINPSTYNYSSFPFGATADTHIASPHYAGTSRTGPLWDFYKRCADEGIEYVLHGGNWIDGHARFNTHELLKVGATAQLEMFMDYYPQVKGVTTLFIAGDDHEGWWWQREGTDIAENAALKAAQAGRKDMHFLGYVEADILVVPKEGIFYNRYSANPEDQKTIKIPSLDASDNAIITKDGKQILRTPNYSIIRLMHGGGGTAQAKSYVPQKIVNSLEERDKAQLYVIGHYHKTSSNYIRNAFVFQVGTMENQSTFMRKKTIPADMGSYILEAHQDPTGAIIEVGQQWIPYVARQPNFKLREYTLHDGS